MENTIVNNEWQPSLFLFDNRSFIRRCQNVRKHPHTLTEIVRDQLKVQRVTIKVAVRKMRFFDNQTNKRAALQE